MIAINATRHRRIALDVRRCDTFWTRLRGLLGRPKPKAGEAVWIEPCGSVHTFGMSYPIDAVFLDSQNRVVRIERKLEPNRLADAPGAHSVLEFASDSSPECGLGEQIVFVGK